MKNPEIKTDAELVQLSLKNPDYFGELVERYEQKLLRYVRRLSGVNHEAAEDVLQEAFLKIYSNLNAFDSDLSFSAWAYRITHNETVSYLRKNKKNETVSLEAEAEDEASLINLLASEINIAAEVSQKDMSQRVRKALNLLSEKYRDVLILRYLQELDYKEISDALRIPMGTVATLVNRAKGKFKEIAEKNHLL